MKRISVVICIFALTLLTFPMAVFAHSDPLGTKWGSKWPDPWNRCYGIYGYPNATALEDVEWWLQDAIDRWNFASSSWSTTMSITYDGYYTCSTNTGKVYIYTGSSSSPYADSLNFNSSGSSCWDCAPAYNRIRVYYSPMTTLPDDDRKAGVLAHEIGHSWDLDHVCTGSGCTDDDKWDLMYPYGDEVYVTSPQDSHEGVPLINMYGY